VITTLDKLPASSLTYPFISIVCDFKEVDNSIKKQKEVGNTSHNQLV